MSKALAALKWPIRIAAALGVLFTLKWMGVRGIVGMLAGMAVMSYLFLSQNHYMMFFVRMVRGETFIDEMRK